MAITRLQQDMLRKFASTFDLVAYYNGEPITIDQGIDIFNGLNLTKKGVEQRREEFRGKLKDYLRSKKYPKDMLMEFGSYWAELTQGGSKMRWETEKTWELDLRLERWNRTNYGRGKQPPPTAPLTKVPIKPEGLF